MVKRVGVGVVLVALLACKSGGSDHKCVSAIELASTRHTSLGTDRDPAKAKENSLIGACIAYCEWGDPTVRAAYDQWKRDNPSSPAVPQAIVGIHLEQQVKACRVRCDALAKGGPPTVKTLCAAGTNSSCRANLNHGGKAATGTGKDHFEAQHVACRAWCTANDADSATSPFWLARCASQCGGDVMFGTSTVSTSCN
ncbi:MAG TPA: hypothetical protein PKD61_21355 [Polyangiaceae bacterium]|nr:hypothetical protein [Polyangiaceae bacterium]